MADEYYVAKLTEDTTESELIEAIKKRINYLENKVHKNIENWDNLSISERALARKDYDALEHLKYEPTLIGGKKAVSAEEIANEIIEEYQEEQEKG